VVRESLVVGVDGAVLLNNLLSANICESLQSHEESDVSVRDLVTNKIACIASTLESGKSIKFYLGHRGCVQERVGS